MNSLDMQPVFRYWLNLPRGVDRRNIPDLLRHLADTLESGIHPGYEVVDLGLERWSQDLDPSDEDYDLPALRVYLAARASDSSGLAPRSRIGGRRPA